MLMRSDAPLVYRVVVLAGSVAAIAGLLLKPDDYKPENWSPQSASQAQLVLTVLALVLITALHSIEETWMVQFAKIVVGGYLVILAPGMQLGYLLAPQAEPLERVAWGGALSMAAIPLALLWLLWLGVSPTREVVLTAAAGIAVVGCALIHLVPVAQDLEDPLS
jgi:hypothetical protein